jgi:DNA-directed RNA polymerase beta subunit
MAIAMGSVDGKRACLGSLARRYLSSRFANGAGLDEFLRRVNAAIKLLVSSPLMDVLPSKRRGKQRVADRAEHLRRVLGKVANLQLLQEMSREGPDTNHRAKKRARLVTELTPPRQRIPERLVRVTPTGQY